MGRCEKWNAVSVWAMLKDNWFTTVFIVNDTETYGVTLLSKLEQVWVQTILAYNVMSLANRGEVYVITYA